MCCSATTVGRETPRTHKKRHVIVIIRIVDAEPQRNRVQERSAGGEGALCGKVVGHVKGPLIRPHREFGSTLERCPTFETAIVVGHKIADKTRRLGRRQAAEFNPHIVG